MWGTGLLTAFKAKLHWCLFGLPKTTIGFVIWPLIKTKRAFVTAFNSLADFLLDTAKSAAQKAILLWLILISLITLSILSYAVFYKAYVPTAQIVKPVYLSFSVCSSGVGICSFPSGNVSFWNEEGTLQQVLGSGQPYSVMLTLEMPESPKNRDLGMFVVAVKMFDRHGAISSTSERSTMLKYYSIITRIADFVGWLLLYFMGFKEHKQSVEVLMFPHLVDDYFQPSVGANVEIRNHAVEIYSCTLTLSAKFTGLKYFLYYWPVVSAMFAFWWNLLIFSVALCIAMYKRGSAMKAMAVSLDLAEKKKADGGRRKEGYEAEAKGCPELDGDEDEDISALTISGAHTKPSDNSREDDDSDAFDIPLVQEPADFISAEDETDIDFMTELRQRRIN